MPIIGNFFLQCVLSNILAFWKNIKDSGLFFGIPLLLSVFKLFRRKLWRCQQICWIFTREMDWLFCPISSRCYPLFFQGCIVFPNAPVWWRSFWVLFPWFPVQQRLQNTRWACLTTASDVAGILSMPSCFVAMWQIRSQRYILSYLWRYLLCWHISS